jgi:anti-sigma B factor antagonist
MNLQTKNIGNATVIYLHGRLDIFVAEFVETDIFDIVENNIGNHIILVLERLDYLSSSGLRIFISLKRVLGLSGCRLVLCNKSNNAVNIFFKIINIKDMFTIFETEEEALQYLSADKEHIQSHLTRDYVTNVNKKSAFM